MKTDSNLSNYWYYDILVEAEKEWIEYLVNGTKPKKFSKTNLIFTERVLENDTNLKGVDFYCTRVMEATTLD